MNNGIPPSPTSPAQPSPYHKVTTELYDEMCKTKSFIETLEQVISCVLSPDMKIECGKAEVNVHNIGADIVIAQEYKLSEMKDINSRLLNILSRVQV